MTSEVHVAKMICKSIDALTREIFLLRKDILEGWRLVTEIKELDRENDIPLPPIPGTWSALLAEGKHFQL